MRVILAEHSVVARMAAMVAVPAMHVIALATTTAVMEAMAGLQPFTSGSAIAAMIIATAIRILRIRVCMMTAEAQPSGAMLAT